MDVMILIGSRSDLDVGKKITDTLDKLGVSYETHIASAHRTPDKVKQLTQRAEDNSAGVIIAGAGMSAHLAGVVASYTLLPVIGVPMANGPLGGIDALYSTVNMPAGTPVATVSVGSAGAVNSALLAVRILALRQPELMEKLASYRNAMATAVEEEDKRLQNGK